MAVFAGALVMKPMTTPVLRRFGFRPVLIANGILHAVGIAVIAALTPDMPLALIYLILFLGGMSRSMQFTAFNAVAFADVPQQSMSGANTLFSTAFQLALGLGVALGAIAVRIGEFAAPHGAASVFPFRIAFALIALVALTSIADSVALSRTAGEQVSKRQPANS
jgi:MFS family permease